MSRNEFCGKSIKEIECILPNIPPEVFFNNFVRSRVPVKFNATSNDLKTDWLFSRKVIDNLGYDNVKVEHRKSAKGRYGEGKEKSMKFMDFLNETRNGNENLYMTTQELEYDAENMPSIVSPPLTKVVPKYLPWRPSLAGNLITQNINMWIGCTSSTPSSSGLHHDYHDNIYVVVKGEKHFTLFSPALIGNMYPVGEVLRVHKNGRINYVGSETTADGSSLSAERSLLASKKVQEISLRLGEVCENSDDSDLEAALDELLDAEMQEDFDDEPVRKRSKMNKVKAHYPVNFSQLGTITDDNNNICLSRAMQRKFPLFEEAIPSVISVTLHAGEMLYLPAGWYHEVKSCGKVQDNNGASSDSDEVFGKNCHVAINYWFHPPDCDDFARPYGRDFWVSDWQQRGLECILTDSKNKKRK